MSKHKSNLINRSKMILETSMDGFCAVDLDGKLLEVNSSLCNITGFSKEELLKMKIADIEATETAEQTAQHINNVMKQGYDRFETKHRRKNGKIIDIEVSTQYCDLDKERFFFSFFRDITKQKLKDEKIRVLSKFPSENPNPVLRITEDGEVLYSNKAGEQLLAKWKSGVGKTVPKKWHNLITKVFLSGKAQEEEEEEVKNKVFLLTIMPIKEAGYANLYARDITEQKHLEAESEIYKERIVRTQKHTYVNAMSAIVAHQLNQPLTTINMLLDKVLEMESAKSQCCPSVLEKIKKSLKEAQRAASIIRNFRQYSKTPAFEATDTVSLSNTANRVITLISQRAKRAKMNISVKALDNLPELEFNETALEQILIIIIQNAIEAADGKKQHKLDIVGNFTDDTVELQFSDDCCGIVPENLDKIFEPFFSTKSEDEGMGLGLDIVRQILISCGGEIHVESQFGKGTSFYVTLPVGKIRKS